jgi:hypothetical protein
MARADEVVVEELIAGWLFTTRVVAAPTISAIVPVAAAHASVMSDGGAGAGKQQNGSDGGAGAGKQ